MIKSLPDLIETIKKGKTSPQKKGEGKNKSTVNITAATTAQTATLTKKPNKKRTIIIKKNENKFYKAS